MIYVQYNSIWNSYQFLQSPLFSPHLTLLEKLIQLPSLPSPFCKTSKTPSNSLIPIPKFIHSYLVAHFTLTLPPIHSQFPLTSSSPPSPFLSKYSFSPHGYFHSPSPLSFSFIFFLTVQILSPSSSNFTQGLALFKFPYIFLLYARWYSNFFYLYIPLRMLNKQGCSQTHIL